MFDLDAEPEVIDAHLARDPRPAPARARPPRAAGARRDRSGRDRGPGDPRSADLGRPRDPPRGQGRRRVRHSGGRARGDRPDPPVPRAGDPRGGARSPSSGCRGARAAAIRAFAAATVPLDGSLGLDALVRELRRLPGVGEWTAQYIAMRAARERDAFPAGDLGLRHALGWGYPGRRGARGRIPALAGLCGDVPVVRHPRLGATSTFASARVICVCPGRSVFSA